MLARGLLLLGPRGRPGTAQAPALSVLAPYQKDGRVVQPDYVQPSVARIAPPLPRALATSAPFVARLAVAARRPTLLGILAALAFAVAARVPYFLGSDFPLNDGGMFLRMSTDLLQAHYVLPESTSYNLESIPFAYPPFSFYLVALITGAFGIDPLTLVRYLPLLANLATVVVVAVLARSMLRGWAAVLAPIIFALIPRSYEWMIMGGGLTRSFGFLFAVSCLVEARHLFCSPTLRRAALCALLAALALATHLELGLFVLYSLGLMAVLHERRVRAVLISAAVAVAMVGLTAPWWLTVVSRHGLAPFEAASLTGEWSTLVDQLGALESFITPPKILLSMPGTFAVLGAFVCLVRGRLFLPIWLPLIFVLNPRSAPSEATVPLGMLAAVGLCEVVGPGVAVVLKGVLSRPAIELASVWHRLARSPQASRAAALIGAAVLLSGVFLAWAPMHPNRHALDVLSDADRQAMSWVASNTAEDTQFLILTPTWSWEDDHVTEWFPVLADRHSLLTPQGSEWLPSEVYARKLCLYDQARQLGSLQRGVGEVEQWARDRGVTFSAIYVSNLVQGTLDWRPLIASARASGDYSVGMDATGVTVLLRNQPVEPRWAASGELVVARDCKSLSEESPETQSTWQALYGPLAGHAWVDEHNSQIGRGTGLLLGSLRRLLGK